jgi:hypothetical protein
MKYAEEILIGSKFDAKGFKAAETASQKLGNNVKKLAGAFGLAFSTRAIVNFGRLAVKASLDQQAEQNRLNQLLRVGVNATTQEIALLNDQAKVLEKIGVVSGGNITQTQSQLATFNLQVSTIEALTPAILDYVTAEKGATASTADFKSMTNGLAQALNGNFTSLTRVGFVLDENTKKQIKSGTETERANALVKVLNSTYKDFNKNLRETDAGQMQVLANSAQEATTIIGTGLIDALKAVGRDNSIEDLASSMESAALASADFIRGLGQIASFEVSGEAKSLIGLLTTPFRRSLSAGPLGAITRLGEQARLGAGGGFPSGVPKDLAALSKYSTVLTKVVKNTKILTAEQKKQLNAAKLKLAIEKANLALNKGEEVFDMDKIQIAAALTSQAEQLGKATSSAQQLQIANDIARLTVKQSILALEDAIAAKDEQAIIAATNKLNADLKVLNVLSGQNVKLADIKSILDSLKPKDLINQANLDAALAKIREMMALLAQATAQSTAKIPTSASLGSGIPVGDFIAPISREVGQAASMDALIEYSEAAQARANAFADLLDLDTAAKLAAIQQTSTGGGFDVGRFRMADNAGMSPVVNVYANTIANPDELTNLIQNSIIQLNKRGDYLTTAGAL